MAPKTFTNWKECCKYLFELIGRNKVLAGENTIIEDTGSGIRVHSQASGSGSGTEYNGYFKVTYYPDEDAYWIEDGADPDGEFAGYIQVGEQNIHCVSEPVAASGAGSFYVNVFYDADAELYDYEYAFEATIPSTPQEVNTELAALTAPVAPATEGNLTQRWTAGAITNINGAYVT
jgi:hypothetical protein